MRPRYHVHYTPTYTCWLNQVERWFGLLSQQVIRRGSFKNVKQLTVCIETFVKCYNRDCAPFRWTATADSILERMARLKKVIYGTPY